MRRLLIALTIVAAATCVPLAGATATAVATETPRHDVSPLATRPDPVLLVHGFNGSGASWHALVRRLLAAGYPRDDIDAISYDSRRSNVDTAHEIASAVDALLARTGARKVDVVSHSMGAISARYYVERLGGEEKVDAFVSLAGVNHGTVLAFGCAVFVSCREMIPGSSLLDRLAPDVSRDAPVRFGAWWSPCDDAIVPRANAELGGATNTETRCLGHSDVTTDPGVLTQVVAFIDRPHTA